MKELSVENLHASIGDREMVRGLSLRVPRGEVHALMGPNGSGKSTLAKVLAGHPDYRVTAGKVLMDGENLLGLERDERARRGIFSGRACRRVSPRARSLRQPIITQSFTKKWSCSGWIVRSRRGRSTRVFPAARKSAPKFCNWLCSNPNMLFSMRPTAALTLMRSRPLRTA